MHIETVFYDAPCRVVPEGVFPLRPLREILTNIILNLSQQTFLTMVISHHRSNNLGP